MILYIVDDKLKIKLTIVAGLQNERALIVCAADVVDFPMSIDASLPSLVGDNPIILALNKVDVLPFEAKVCVPIVDCRVVYCVLY